VKPATNRSNPPSRTGPRAFAVAAREGGGTQAGITLHTGALATPIAPSASRQPGGASGSVGVTKPSAAVSPEATPGGAVGGGGLITRSTVAPSRNSRGDWGGCRILSRHGAGDRLEDEVCPPGVGRDPTPVSRLGKVMAPDACLTRLCGTNATLILGESGDRPPGGLPPSDRPVGPGAGGCRRGSSPRGLTLRARPIIANPAHSLSGFRPTGARDARGGARPEMEPVSSRRRGGVGARPARGDRPGRSRREDQSRRQGFANPAEVSSHARPETWNDSCSSCHSGTRLFPAGGPLAARAGGVGGCSGGYSPAGRQAGPRDQEGRS